MEALRKFNVRIFEFSDRFLLMKSERRDDKLYLRQDREFKFPTREMFQCIEGKRLLHF